MEAVRDPVSGVEYVAVAEVEVTSAVWDFEEVVGG